MIKAESYSVELVSTSASLCENESWPDAVAGCF